MDLEPWHWLYIILAAAAVFIALITFYAMKTGKKKKKEPLEKAEVEERWPSRIERSVTKEEASKAQNELRTLGIEREILSHAIRHLYEAQVEGKISEEERDLLAQEYKDRMLKIKDLISRNESVVALHELEKMQGDLVKLFNERFDELNTKIEDVRSRVGVELVKEAPIPTPPPPKTSEKERKRERKRPPRPSKTEAEKRIEEIRAEVEKVLERLGQIEVEA